MKLTAISVLPVDTTGLPRDTAIPIPVPSIEHTLIDCDSCGRQCWIGPKQLAFLRVYPTPTACYFCIIRGFRLGVYDEVRLTVLNPNEAKIPRRT